MKTFFLYKIPLCLFGKVIKLLAFAHPSYCHLIGSKRRGVGGSLSQHAPQVTWPGESLLGRSPRTVTRGRYASYWNAFLFITGRNEVVAKVIFLHLFVILFTGAGGGGGGIPEGTEADTPPEQTPPPGKQTPAYGLRAAGTHPTGMHSCIFFKMPEQTYFHHRHQLQARHKIWQMVLRPSLEQKSAQEPYLQRTIDGVGPIIHFIHIYDIVPNLFNCGTLQFW